MATLIALRGLSAMARISNEGFIVGTLVPAAAPIAFMFARLTSGKASQTPAVRTLQYDELYGSRALYLDGVESCHLPPRAGRAE